MDKTPTPRPEADTAALNGLENVTFEIQEVKYSLPGIMRELQLERTQSFFAKEIIDQVEISKIFADARKARAKRPKS